MTVIVSNVEQAGIEHIEALISEYQPEQSNSEEKKQIAFSVEFLLAFEADHRHGAVITLVDFGYSYGKIILNGVEESISHMGGICTNHPEAQADSTHGF